MRFTNRQLHYIREMLVTARDAATMESANLFPFDPHADEKMNELRKLLQLHHSSWITGPIDAALDELDLGKK